MRRVIAWSIAAALLGAVGVLAGRETGDYAKLAAYAAPNIPPRFAGWQCLPVGPRTASYRDPNADSDWSGVCEDESGVRSQVYLGYAAWQRHKRRLASPRLHYPDEDQRWSYVMARSAEIALDGDCRGRIGVSETLLRHSVGGNHAVVYWYQRGSRTFSDEFAFRLAMMGQNLVGEATDAVIVRISMHLRNGELDQVFEREKKLAGRIYCELLTQVNQS